MQPEVHGRWKGVFTLGRGYEEDEGRETSFILFIENNKEGQFKGRSVDYAGHAENFNPASIVGYIQGTFISFRKQYPFLYAIDEKGEVVYDKAQVHPEIHYEGRYDPKTCKFSGSWEMVIDVIEMGENDLEQLLQGQWEMSKDEND